MRVLLSIHHELDPDLGAPGTTLRLGSSLEALGCDVSYFGYREAFGPVWRADPWSALQFPWRLQRELRGRAREFDVIDASTGDAWLWATLNRGNGSSRRPALVTRSHGLEHVRFNNARRAAVDFGEPLSPKARAYHGGYRLWEVRRSLQLADHCLFLNPAELRYAVDRLGIARERMSVVANGIPANMVAERIQGAAPPLELAFIGRWVRDKGAREVVEAVERLVADGIPHSLLLLGTIVEERAVLSDFSDEARGNVKVVPRFRNEELPELLQGRHALLCPSYSEGFSVALIEAMACGLVPLATPVGGAAEVIEDGHNGFLLPVRDGQPIANRLRQLAQDPRLLARTRGAALAASRDYVWDEVASGTLAVYERVAAS